jgi:hypothetical protein
VVVFIRNDVTEQRLVGDVGGIGLPPAYLLTYLLTPWSRVLLEKLTINFASSQEIPRIYGTRKSLTLPTSAHHLSLS